MTTRPLGPPPFIPDDPGPWSAVSHVQRLAQRPGRRRPQPPSGLVLSPPPSIDLALVGIESDHELAGAGPMRVIAAAREPAYALTVDAEGDLLRGVSPYVRRAWSLPDLTLQLEERTTDDPTEGLPEIGPAAGLQEGLPDLAAAAPDGELVAVAVKETRFNVIAVVRRSDRAVVRWIRGPRAAAWSPDGKLFAVGGEWGVILAAPRRAGDAG